MQKKCKKKLQIEKCKKKFGGSPRHGGFPWWGGSLWQGGLLGRRGGLLGRGVSLGGGLLGGGMQGMLGHHPPCEQNDKQVQKYYLAPNFVCGR